VIIDHRSRPTLAIAASPGNTPSAAVRRRNRRERHQLAGDIPGVEGPIDPRPARFGDLLEGIDLSVAVPEEALAQPG